MPDVHKGRERKGERSKREQTVASAFLSATVQDNVKNSIHNKQMCQWFCLHINITVLLFLLKHVCALERFNCISWVILLSKRSTYHCVLFSVSPECRQGERYETMYIQKKRKGISTITDKGEFVISVSKRFPLKIRICHSP